ncbi:MAG: type IV-A pilus assembly ATPase PilB [Candidatus Muirbacterium halophilum]|nr:type IV-A pilus assembly ATPase PilB [Candidatus Muirbacterium halophilum]MCK9476934.1 type IV-A pilus assembly ATPase PilB [Candidatus Muirbacterium halophilum]
MLDRKKRLGDLLVELGYINDEQVKQALDNQKETKKRLGQVVIDLGFVTENDILKVLSDQLGVPVINLNEYDISADVIKLIPVQIAKKHTLIPLFKDSNRLTIAMADPLDVFAIDQIQYKTNLKVDIVISSKAEIEGAQKQYYSSSADVKNLVDGFQEKIEEVSMQNREEKMEKINEDSPVVKFVNLILKEGINEKASDIHIEPDEKGVRIRYRVDGVLQSITEIPPKIQSALISRIKIMAGMDIAEKRLPQDGRINIKLSSNREIDVRVNTLPTVWGEKIVMRLLDKSSVMLGLEKLSFLPNHLKMYENALAQPNGIVLLTGPTGSGKTSTLYAGLESIKSPKVNITTVENPVEYRLPLINQVQTHAEIGMTFAAALRSILRQDPDIIMIGEIRDAETAEIAIESALTGHLVLSTLHTNDASGAVTRLMEMGIESYLLTPTLLLVVAQRLARRICDKCKVVQKPDQEILDDLGINGDFTFYMGEGCVSCNKTGYKGRVGIHEMLVLDDDIKRIILAKESSTVIKDAAIKNGMQSLRENAIEKAKLGWTTLEEVIRITKGE